MASCPCFCAKSIGHAVHAGLGLVAAAIFLLASEPYARDATSPKACVRFLSASIFTSSSNLLPVFSSSGGKPPQSVWDRGSVQLNSARLGKAKLLACLIAVLLPVAMFFVQRGLIWQKIALGGGAALSAALLLLPEHFLGRNHQASQTFLPTTLFVIHANLIRDQMADDLTRGAKVPYPREWLGHVQRALSDEIAKSVAARSRIYSTIGFDPDYLWHGQTSIAAQLHKEFGNNVSALCAFYRFYYWRIWRERPLLVLKKIARQMAIFYAPICPSTTAANLCRSMHITEVQRPSTSSPITRFLRLIPQPWIL